MFGNINNFYLTYVYTLCIQYVYALMFKNDEIELLKRNAIVKALMLGQ